MQIGLQGIATTRIGHPTTGARGISGGEAKRLAFAAEVIIDNREVKMHIFSDMTRNFTSNLA